MPGRAQKTPGNRGVHQNYSQRHSFFWIPHTRISLKQLRKPLDLEWTQKLRQILEYPKRAIFTIFMIFEADL